MAKSYLGQSDLPRGLRNNNPGNIVKSSTAWQGKVPLSQNTDSRFEQFTELRWGIRAMMKNLISYYKNRGLTTVSKMISRWAPAFENNTANYITIVSNIVGIGINEFIPVLSKEILIKISKAIVAVENGFAFEDYLNDDDYNEAYDIIGESAPSATEIKKKVCSQCGADLV